MESETLTDILETIAAKGVSNNNDCVWTTAFLVAISKADNFELTASFAEETDKERLGKIITAIKATCGATCEEQLIEL